MPISLMQQFESENNAYAAGFSLNKLDAFWLVSPFATCVFIVLLHLILCTFFLFEHKTWRLT